MRRSLISALTLATMMALPTASQARDCLGMDRVGHHVARTVDGVGRMVTRVGDGMVRVGDHMLGWLFCDRRRT